MSRTPITNLIKLFNSKYHTHKIILLKYNFKTHKFFFHSIFIRRLKIKNKINENLSLIGKSRINSFIKKNRIPQICFIYFIYLCIYH